MNIYYLVRNDRQNKCNAGFFNKFYGQIKTFLDYGDVIFIYKETKRFYAEFNSREGKVLTKKISISGKAVFNHLLYYYYISKLFNDNPPGVIYIRYKISDPTFLLFLWNVRRKFKDCRIFVEFPTFPYDKNWMEESLIKRVCLPVDMIFRTQLHRFVDFAVNFTKSDNIFNINTICIKNGISINDIPIRKPDSCNNRDLVLIGVAGISYWHGFDRIITGLSEYYKNVNNTRKVYFNIVGVGRELPKLKMLTKQLKLCAYVKFHGYQTGQALDNLFNESHIAVSSIGIHRLNIDAFTSLKSREYICRGIPFIMSGCDNSLSDDFKYVKHIAGDDSPAGIEEIIRFYDNVARDKNYIAEMRKYSEKLLTWDCQLKDVIDKFGLSILNQAI